jgi:hypothetical protein
VASGTERMRAMRKRRSQNLRIFTLAISQDDVAEIARASAAYQGVLSGDRGAAAEGLALFISDTVACLDHLQ